MAEHEAAIRLANRVKESGYSHSYSAPARLLAAALIDTLAHAESADAEVVDMTERYISGAKQVGGLTFKLHAAETKLEAIDGTIALAEAQGGDWSGAIDCIKGILASKETTDE